MLTRTVLIIGATGQQGGSTVDALLKYTEGSSGLKIRGLTRTPDGKAVQALAARGVEPVKGELDDRASIERALEGCNAVFLVTDWKRPGDIVGEVQQAKLLVETAKKQGASSSTHLKMY